MLREGLIEEAALLGGRLEGWQRARPSKAILRDAVLRTATQG
jgi:hypothetical protein